MSKHMKYGAAAIAVLTATFGLGAVASATEGYFQHGYGVKQKALGGAGVAHATDAMSLAINPAGMVHVKRQFQAQVSAFSPRRSFTGSGGPSFTPGGEVESGSNWFPVPGMAYAQPLDNGAVFSLAVYGNGGMNTSYAPDLANPACASPPLPASTGVFCGGSTGVNLNQLFVAAGYSFPVSDNVAIGISPIFVLQQFEANGLAAFSYDMFGNPLTIDPTALTNNESSYSTGFGVRLGIEVALSDNFRIGAAYQPSINMSEFDEYAGLFAEQGDFDIPSNYTIGAAFDVNENTTILFDYRRINYTDVASVSNSPVAMAQFGSDNGPGFGWDDVEAYKLGIEWAANDEWTWRAGAAFNNNPISPVGVTLNILAPGVQEQHYTGGFSYEINERNSFDFSFMYSPESTVSGIEITPAGPNPGHQIELAMNQFDVTFGWTYTFGD